MNRVFIRQNDNSKKREKDKYRIAVTGLGRDVGTTFIATALAFFYGEKYDEVAFTQCISSSVGRSLLFDEAAMDRRFANRDFIDYYSIIADEKPAGDISNLEKGVNWIIPVPHNDRVPDMSEIYRKSRLIHLADSRICIYDIDSSGDWDQFLLDMDEIIVIADPLPSRLIAGAERFKILKKLELSGCRVRWIVNRNCRGVSRRQVKGYLKACEIIWVPFFSPDDIYSDEYSCRFHWENKAIRCKLMEIFTKVSH